MMQLVRRIGHQVGVVVGRLNQYGLASGPQGLKLILEPDTVTVAPDDIGEFLGIAKGARGAWTTVVVGLTVRLLNVKYQRHGLYPQRHDLGAMELGDAQCRRHGIAVGRGNAATGKDGQAVARVLDQADQVFEVVLDRRTGSTTVRQNARDAAVGERVNCLLYTSPSPRDCS